MRGKMGYLANKTLGLCDKCNNSWVDFCKRYPDVFEKTADGEIWFVENISNENKEKYLEQYNNYSGNCKVSGVELPWNYYEPIFLRMTCLRDFLDGPALEL